MFIFCIFRLVKYLLPKVQMLITTPLFHNVILRAKYTGLSNKTVSMGYDSTRIIPFLSVTTVDGVLNTLYIACPEVSS